MKKTITITLIMLAASFAAIGQTTAFTYQGKLNDSSLSANGTYDFTFSLCFVDAGAPGDDCGPSIARPAVNVTGGIFTVSLDFGQGNFDGGDRWLEIAVKKTTEANYSTLVPRQPIQSSIYAQRSIAASGSDSLTAACVSCVNDSHIASLNGSKITGVVNVANGGTGSGTQNFVDLSTNQTVNGNKTFTGSISGNGSGLTNINGANIANNSVTSSALASDTFPNDQNYSRLGMLRWDLLGQQVSVGSEPVGVAFDGTHIWVANSISNNVTKLRTSDGAVQGTFAVGRFPYSVAFDGANIWVANVDTHNVTKLRASDGAVQGTFAVGDSPQGVAFDGANIWVANDGSDNVTKLRASDGAVQGTFAVGSRPVGVAFDGANIWVANYGSSNITKLRASDGAVQGTFAVGTDPSAVAFDGANIWVANDGSNNVTKLRASDGAVQGTFAVGSRPVGVAFDGANIWVANIGNNVTKLRASDGAPQGTFAVGSVPRGIAFDGTNIWVANSGSNNVTKLPIFR